MRNVITISREAGSNGDTIGYELANRLGYTCINRSFVDLIARKTRVAPWQVERIERHPEFTTPPRAPSTEQTYDERYGRDVDQLIRRLGYGEALETDDYLRALRNVMEDLAGIGQVVIIGRGAQVILHGRPDVYHVRILAPRDERIEALRASESLSSESAAKRVALIDGLRTDLLRRMGWTDDDQKLYDLIFDSSGLSVDQCVERIQRRLASDEREASFEPAMGRMDDTR